MKNWSIAHELRINLPYIDTSSANKQLALKIAEDKLRKKIQRALDTLVEEYNLDEIKLDIIAKNSIKK